MIRVHTPSERLSPPLSSEAAEIGLYFHYFVIQVFRDKVVDCRDIASDGLIETLACLLSRCSTYGATWERRTLRGITAGVIPNYSDAQLHLLSLVPHRTFLSSAGVPEDSFHFTSGHIHLFDMTLSDALNELPFPPTAPIRERQNAYAKARQLRNYRLVGTCSPVIAPRRFSDFDCKTTPNSMHSA